MGKTKTRTGKRPAPSGNKPAGSAGDGFRRWLDGDVDLLADVTDSTESMAQPRAQKKHQDKDTLNRFRRRAETLRMMQAEKRGFYLLYRAFAVLSCLLLIGVFLFTISYLPRFGQENPETTEVVRRYVENGLEETGAVNIVAGMILDYRAFDTLGESHVLFTALLCAMTLLLIDRKNMRHISEDYYTVRYERYYDLSKDLIFRNVGKILIPCIFLYGIYILVNGQNSPGGGFSGGAVLGAGMMLFSAAFGFEAADRVFSRKRIFTIVFIALAFYSLAKGYVFFTGANGLENHIPKGIPGAILSGGLILPLDIAVGIVVAFTMYGFYSLFKRGTIGNDGNSAG